MKRRILLEIDSEVFERLVASEKLSLREFSCPNKDAKQKVHDIFLALAGQQINSANTLAL